MFISVAQAAEAAAQHAEHGGFFSEAETWVAITWVIVVAFLARPVYRGITAALDLRREKIRSRIEEAERLRAEAQEMLASYQKKQRDALKEAQGIIANAKAEAERLAQQAAANLEDLLKRREQQAVERIAQAEAEALREVRNQAVDIAIGATRRLIADNLSSEQASALVDAVIQDLPNRLH
ncbi:F0F1 ATP synthase subunit B [Telmatospirillum sp.]|uniref:F0F1 ATP synthase subunit B family protein n=1 Tax=Telmatospirillum sp. TaxID=2079197 RepID=UPI00284FAB8E|nr:F0F1 ATP synthase subunit B [Telmatospirillum sp.]MDR3435952.1 F0F1 ATP synthase subunit B [Telmatospirillum sp.]